MGVLKDRGHGGVAGMLLVGAVLGAASLAGCGSPGSAPEGPQTPPSAATSASTPVTPPTTSAASIGSMASTESLASTESPATAGFRATSGSGPSASGAKSTAAALATGSQAKLIVTKAVVGAGRHGPYRVDLTMSASSFAITRDVLPPDRIHDLIHDRDGGTTETIEIGSKKWLKDPVTKIWAAMDMPSNTMAALPTTFPVLTVTEKAPTDLTARVFVGTTTLAGRTTPFTVRVDRSGRLLLLTLGSTSDWVRYRCSYGLKITIKPPV